MIFLALLLLMHLSEASIRLQHSILYDEVDFKGVDQVTTHMCAAGCKVYATITGTDRNIRITQNITIIDPNTQETTSIFELGRLFMEDSGEKGYLEIGAARTVTILNTNADLESTALVLWIVSANAPYYGTAEVFEPRNLNRTEGVAFAPITILSAYSFTVTVAPGDGNGVFARFAGYDAIDRNSEDKCYDALDKDFGEPFAGLTLVINGPLLTLSYDTVKYPRSQVALTGNYASESDFEITMVPEKPTFLSSPGFMCGRASHQVYRSSVLMGAHGIAYTLLTPNDKELKFNFVIEMDTDADHSVMIYDLKTTFYQSFFGNIHDRTSRVDVFLQTYMASVSFTPGEGDFYGMRVWVEDEGGQATKTTTVLGKETTASVKETTTSIRKSTSNGKQTTAFVQESTTSSTVNPSLASVIVIVAALFA